MVRQNQPAYTFSDGAHLPQLLRGPRQPETANNSDLNVLLNMVADQTAFDLKQASDFARTAALQDPDLEAKLIKAANGVKCSADEVIRIIRILECICPKSQLLSHLLSIEGSFQPRIRSKIVLTIGRLVQNANWLQEQLEDENPRVRANAVEALWEVRIEGASELFLQAARDPNNRVVGNAAYGLYKLGSQRAIPILCSLLANPSKSFWKTGLWAITQLGDPRFLRQLEAPPAGLPEDQEEKKLRELARQRLTARLQASHFAGTIMLDLSSFTGNETRIAKLSCLSPDSHSCYGQSELNALNFLIEENGRQIEEFECRWIEPAEKISVSIVAPASLSSRGPSLRSLAQQASSGDAVSILRYLPSLQSSGKDVRNLLAEGSAVEVSIGLGSQGSSPLNNFGEAVLKGFDKLTTAAGPQHLFLVVDRSVEAKLSANIRKLARAIKVIIHVVAATDIADELSQALRLLCEKSGGTFLISDSAVVLPALINAVRARYNSSCELSWKGIGKNPSNVLIRCISGCGYGELDITR